MRFRGVPPSPTPLIKFFDLFAREPNFLPLVESLGSAPLLRCWERDFVMLLAIAPLLCCLLIFRVGVLLSVAVQNLYRK